MNKIAEMSYNRPDAISRCAELGEQFVEHFIKVMKAGGEEDLDFVHHCDVEMQNWYIKVRTITLKPKRKLLNSDALMDWFFTLGSNIDIIIPEEYEDVYSLFVAKLLSDKNKKVSSALSEAAQEVEGV